MQARSLTTFGPGIESTRLPKTSGSDRVTQSILNRSRTYSALYTSAQLFREHAVPKRASEYQRPRPASRNAQMQPELPQPGAAIWARAQCRRVGCEGQPAQGLAQSLEQSSPTPRKVHFCAGSSVRRPRAAMNVSPPRRLVVKQGQL
jgi:hypothetical protein